MALDHGRLHDNSLVSYSVVASAIFQASKSTIANADGVQQCAEYLVSVGCGTATIEEHTELLFPDMQRITLIDPHVTSFSRAKRVSDAPFEAHFKTVHDFLVAHPDAYGNCVLILIWPSPDYATYDIEAVFQLHPINIVFLGADPDKESDESGAAGSLLLYKFFQMQKQKAHGSQYRLLHRRSYVTLDSETNFRPEELMLRRAFGIDRTSACVEWYALKSSKRLAPVLW